jgi:hypothetical protein
MARRHGPERRHPCLPKCRRKPSPFGGLILAPKQQAISPRSIPVSIRAN